MVSHYQYASENSASDPIINIAGVPLDFLKETGKLSCKQAGTLLELNWKQKDCEKDTPMNKERYQSITKEAHMLDPY